MQTSEFNKRSNPDTFMGVDADKLAAFPPRLRSEIIAALSEAQDAARSGDEDRQAAATRRLVDLMAEIQDHQAEAAAEKLFKADALRVRGDHDVMRTLAKRAGVGG